MSGAAPSQFRPARRTIATLVPRASRKLWRYVTGRKKAGGGHTDSARYCYAVWLRHLASAPQAMARLDGARVLELGPGLSIGVGLCALLSGAREYYAIDPVDYQNPAKDARILAELVELFRARAPIPDHHEFPDMFPRLADYRFPAVGIAGDDQLRPERLAAIAAAIRGDERSEMRLVRAREWSDSRIPDGGVDLVLSQAVMLYVGDLDDAYARMARWLSPAGRISHTYNFTSLQHTPAWNGHWACSPAQWLELEGQHPYRLSRLPLSAHMQAIERAGMTIEHIAIEERPGGIGREELAPEFVTLTDQDLIAARALIQIRRPRSS